jgi:hypothetical protein
MKKLMIFLMHLSLVISLALVGGCTLIGLGVGAAIDSSQPDYTRIPGWDVSEIKTGKRIILNLHDGKVVAGKFQGLGKMSEVLYQSRYKIARQEITGVELPVISEKITVVDKNSRRLDYLFRGFEPDVLLVGTLAQKKSGLIRLNMLQEIQTSKGLINPENLQNLMSENRLPFYTTILVEKGSEGDRDTVSVPVNDIYQVQYQNSKNAMITGALIGAAADLVVIAVAVNAGEEERQSQTTTEIQFSCPFVYSFDGRQYRLDAEPFGGSIFKAAERTDWDNLDYLKESDGKYYLRITNELPESQYVNEAKLMVIDHSPTSRIVPDFGGNLHSLNQEVKPIRANDFNGNNVLNLVKDSDKNFWVSSPFNRNPDDPADVRDGIILDFNRPVNTGRVKLVLNLQNTLWASYLQGHILTLHGRNLPQWYELMNQSAEMRQVFQRVMIREGMLLVKVWNDGEWKSAGYVWEVGPSLPKDQIVVLDLSGIPGDILRIKLESTAGLWMIKSVAADYSTDTPLSVQTLYPESATDQNGKNVREILMATDELYFDMPTNDYFTTLSFAAPVQPPSSKRTFILKCSGYYTIHVPANGESQEELIARLFVQPGAFGQYSLKQLYREMAIVKAKLGYPVGSTGNEEKR